jgi:hypothetical protein
MCVLVQNCNCVILETVEMEAAADSGTRFINFQELFLTRILNAILNRLRINS